MKRVFKTSLALALGALLFTTVACTPVKDPVQRRAERPDASRSGDRVAITGSRIKRESHRAGREELGLSSRVIVIERDEFEGTGAQTVGGVLERRGF